MKSVGLNVISFLLALLAIIGFIVQPVIPAYAAAVDGFIGGAQAKQTSATALPTIAEKSLDEFILDSQISRGLRNKLADHAARGEAAILSRAQMNVLAKTRPALYAKLMRAYRTTSVPKLTADEKTLVDQLTASNIAAFKAGRPAVSTCGERRTDRTPSTPKLVAADTKVADQLTVSTIAAFKAETLSTLGKRATPIRRVAAVYDENCSDFTGAWVVVGLLLTVIIVGPLFCAIAAQIGTAPNFCRGVTGP